MFEAVELGRKVPKAQFDEQEPGLRTELLAAQRRLRETPIAVLVIVAGVVGAGRSQVVNRLNEWLDARGVQTHGFWEETDEERERPEYWRFWRRLPPRGTVGIMFGSWYTQSIVRRTVGEIDDAELERRLARVADFERMLTRDGTLILKFWFHVSEQTQTRRLKKKKRKDRGKGFKSSPLDRKYAKRYRDFTAVAEHVIRATDTGESPWHLVEAANRRYRDLCVGRTLLDTLRARLDRHQAASPEPAPSAVPTATGSSLTVLDRVDLSPVLAEEEYHHALRHNQRRLGKLAWAMRERGRSTVAVFEGWDAAGKGGAIRRATWAMDARLYRIISVAAPTDEERAQHYLWRFWRQLPGAGYLTIYDRSWYGRVLVERVEGFAAAGEWMRAYQEINDFEEQLSEHGILLAKFWIHISPEEQLRRFREREKLPWKQHKITDEDWRNRDKWEDYKAAVNEMVTRTSTAHAPWHLIPGDSKRYARVQVLKILCRGMEARLK